jgi:hypothetical protein
MLNDDYKSAGEGILSPQTTTISANTVLYRFGNTKGKYGAMGPWWFEESVMNHLRSGAEKQAALDPRKAGVPAWLALNSRFILAIKLEFSRADVLLAVRTTAPLQAYTGTGKPMIDYLGSDKLEDATVTYRMTPKPWAKQLYLCDFASARHHLQIFNTQDLPETLERMPVGAGR